MNLFSLFFLSFLGFQVFAQKDYIVAKPTIEILHPKGFSVSIPDDDEIKLFAFHGKINEDFEGLEAGTFARDIIKAKNGKWTFTDRTTKFKEGDVIYYWLHVINKNGLGYNRVDESYTVTNIPKSDNTNNNQPQPPIQTTFKPPTPATSTPAVCYETPTKVNGASACAGTLIFEEDFNDLNRWQTEVRFAGEPDYEFVTYVSDRENLFLQNGQLHIKPTFAENRFQFGFVRSPIGLDLKLECTASSPADCKRIPFGSNILPPTFSGRINSKPSFSFLYGKIDIRAKLPKGNWIYPQLYLTPKKYVYGSGYNSGEMRVAFVLGNRNLNRDLLGGLILGSDQKGRTYATKNLPGNTNWSDDFHVYTLEWRRDSVTLSVDDKVYGRIYPPPAGYGDVYSSDASEKWRRGDVMAPFDQEMIVTLGVGVGGHAIPDLDGKPYRNEDAKETVQFYQNKGNWLPTWQQDSELIVDYVKVFAL